MHNAFALLEAAVFGGAPHVGEVLARNSWPSELLKSFLPLGEPGSLLSHRLCGLLHRSIPKLSAPGKCGDCQQEAILGEIVVDSSRLAAASSRSPAALGLLLHRPAQSRSLALS